MTAEVLTLTQEENIGRYSLEGNFNPVATLAQAIAKHDTGVTVSVSEISANNLENVTATIKMTLEGEDIMSRLLDTPEMKTLTVASRHNFRDYDLTELDKCDWDDDTKKKVTAHYYTQRARLLNLDSQTAIDADVREFARDKSNEFEQTAEDLLDDLKPLSFEEVQEMINSLVEKSLSTS